MVLVVCIDDNGGMSFNRRRQSRDRALIDRLLLEKADAPLYCEPYSKPLFPPDTPLVEDTAFLSIAGMGDWCLLERQSPLPYLDKIQRLVVFKWNKLYPADTYLDLPLDRFTLLYREDFVGSSHDSITMEIYTHEQAE